MHKFDGAESARHTVKTQGMNLPSRITVAESLEGLLVPQFEFKVQYRKVGVPME